MAFIAWIVLGLTLGGIVSKLMPHRRRRLVNDVVVATAGAVAAGLVFSLVSGLGFALTLPSLIASALGASLLLGANHLKTAARLT